jgi:REP element-mobilizing transposase RayT
VAPPRIEVPDGIYHVTSRGNNREPLFWSNVDRATFMVILARVAMLFDWRLWAWCLMTNHYHLVVQIRETGLSKGMQRLNTGYSRSTNVRHARQRHLFQNRFASRLIEVDSHLLEANRYVVLNPVRAGMAKRPDTWPWTSYRATVGLEPAPSFLVIEELLGMLSPRRHDGRRAYREFVAAGLEVTLPSRSQTS